MTPLEFARLSLEEKEKICIDRGRPVTYNSYYGQMLMLFQIDSFFVEIFFSHELNSVTEIQPWDGESRLGLHTSRVDISAIL